MHKDLKKMKPYAKKLELDAKKRKEKKIEGWTSIKPENNGLGVRVLGSFDKPVEKSSPGFFIDRDVPRKVGKAEVEALPWELGNSVQFLLGKWVGRRS